MPERNAGLKTRNPTLKSWCPRVKELDKLLDLDEESRSQFSECKNFSVHVAYQRPIKVKFKDQKEEVLCNTFEDALLMENLEFFKNNSSSTGLWKKFNRAMENSNDLKELKGTIFQDLQKGGKSEFALNLLDIPEPRQLQPPSYILDGLNWLIRQLKKRQETLGIVTPEPVENTETQ